MFFTEQINDNNNDDDDDDDESKLFLADRNALIWASKKIDEHAKSNTPIYPKFTIDQAS